MFTVVAYAESVDQGGSYNAFNAVPDQHITTSGTVIYIGSLNYLIGYAIHNEGSAPCGAYLDSPSLRRICLVDIANVANATTSSGQDDVVLFPASPVALSTNEGLECYVCDDPGSATQQSALVYLADGALAPVSGEIFTVRATATITAAVNTWVNGNLTFRQTLPVGRYQVVGARAEGTNLNYFRFVPVGYAFRPGGVGCQDANDQDPKLQRFGGLGVWFEFDSVTPPTVEILANADCTAQTFYLDLIKIA